MKTFTRDSFKILRADIDAALALVATNHGINLSIGNISFSDDKFTTKMTGYIMTSEYAGKVAKVIEAERALVTDGHRFGLKAKDHGREFTFKRRTYKLIGLRPRARKYPIVGQDQSGKNYFFTAKVLT